MSPPKQPPDATNSKALLDRAPHNSALPSAAPLGIDWRNLAYHIATAGDAMMWVNELEHDLERRELQRAQYELALLEKRIGRELRP